MLHTAVTIALLMGLFFVIYLNDVAERTKSRAKF